MRQVVDARGTAVALPDRVGRVVSLVPSLTEWLVLAGVGERLVGVTDWCVGRPPPRRGDQGPGHQEPRPPSGGWAGPGRGQRRGNRKLDVQRLELTGWPCS